MQFYLFCYYFVKNRRMLSTKSQKFRKMAKISKGEMNFWNQNRQNSFKSVADKMSDEEKPVLKGFKTIIALAQ